MTEKKITAQQIRNKLWKLQSELHSYIGANYLTSKYRIKVSYMLMWLRLIPVKSDYLKGWNLPDVSTIQSYQEAAKPKNNSKSDGGKPRAFELGKLGRKSLHPDAIILKSLQVPLKKKDLKKIEGLKKEIGKEMMRDE